MNSSVSVIIPVFNDSKRLRLCLDALEKQTYDRDSYEVIVVDNHSTEDIKGVVENYSKAVYTSEVLSGSYVARNTGLSIAKGEILAFTDSDCIPVDDWIEKGVKRFLETPNCGLIAGQINLFFRIPNRPTSAELYDRLTFLNQDKYIKEENYGATANLITSKEIFETVGLFNSQLKSGGDREWGKRVFAAGYKQVYADDVCVHHPARHGIGELKQKTIRVVDGQFSSETAINTSLIDRLLEYARDAKPSFRYIRKILFSNEKMFHPFYRLGIIYVYMSLRYVRAWRKLRLSFHK